jgi:hypothetical protein
MDELWFSLFFLLFFFIKVTNQAALAATRTSWLMYGQFGFKNTGDMVAVATTVADGVALTQDGRLAFDTGHFINEVFNIL